MQTIMNTIKRTQTIDGSGIKMIPLMRFNYWSRRVDVIQASDINNALDTIDKYNEKILGFIRIDQVINDIGSPYDFCMCELTSINRNDNTKDINGVKRTEYTFRKNSVLDAPMLYVVPKYRQTDSSLYINDYTYDGGTQTITINEPDNYPTPFRWGYTKLSIDDNEESPVLKETYTLATLIVDDLDNWNAEKGNDRDGMFYILVRE